MDRLRKRLEDLPQAPRESELTIRGSMLVDRGPDEDRISREVIRTFRVSPTTTTRINGGRTGEGKGGGEGFVGHGRGFGDMFDGESAQRELLFVNDMFHQIRVSPGSRLTLFHSSSRGR